MKRFGVIVGIVAVSTLLLGACALPIASEGKSAYVIALPDAPSAVERTAAAELQQHLLAATGAKLEIVSEREAAGKPMISVGATALYRRNFADNETVRKLDAIALKTDGQNLILGGHPDRGVLYAVYEFLEKYAGIRWWTSTVAKIPKNPDLSVEVKDEVYAPALEYREVYYLDAIGESFASKLRSNGFWTKLTPAYGGKLNVYGWCHTFEQIMPPERYFKDHPEWFALVNGKRQGKGAQLCLTNPEMRQEFLKQTLVKIQRDPKMWQMSVSQNDNQLWCECPKCTALVKAEGSESGPLIDFVNFIASGVKAAYPDLPVSTLAYQKSRHVPKTLKPADNVCIWLCNIENNFGQSMEQGADNADFRKDIEEWSAISRKLFVWSYVAFFGNFMVPHPNLTDLGNDIRYFVKMNAKGVFPQGDYYCNIGDFVALRAWLTGKLLWNPELDQRELTREFLEGYYGSAAAPYLMEYLDLISDAAKRSHTNISCFKHLGSYDWMTRENIAKAYELFGKAKQAASGNPVEADRVRQAQMTLDTAYLMRLPSEIRDAKRQGRELPAYGPDMLKLADEYVELVNRYQPQKISLGKNFAKSHLDMRTELKNALECPVPPECRDLPGDRWAAYEEDSLWLLRDKSLADIVADPAATNGFALKLAADHCQWAAYLPLHGLAEKKFTNNVEEIQRYIVNIAVRADADTNSGNALYFGVYSHNLGQTMISKPVPLAACRGGEYRIFSLPAMKLDNDIAIWISPGNRPYGEMRAIYLDRITIVREK